MGKVKVAAFSISIDGYGAGVDQSLENPLGVRGLSLHEWAFSTRTFRQMLGQEGGSTGVDESFAAVSFENVGAWIIGRNMFGPLRGPWTDNTWKGWWGENPPYHVPVFVLTHHARDSIAMEGDTTFHFVTEGLQTALDQARATAQGKDVRIGGGVSTIRQGLVARMIDELHIAISPVLLGAGESLFSHTNLAELGYECTRHVGTEMATHVILQRR